GWALADRMIEREDLQFSVLKSSGDLTELLEIFETNREVLIVDAMETKEEVDIKLWDAVDQNIPSFLSGATSHVLGLS
ncbi:MAG: hypothetical protein KDD35_10300, partial [Bdellovibrionales bacterium]|nr:hypothetical protein [Bdellovibrionales bacterium]